MLRIYPAYLFQLTMLLVAAAFGYGTMLDGGALLAHLFLWFNMGEPRFGPLVGVWFTLPIEFGFYLVLPLLAPLIDRRRWPWLLLGAVVFAIASRYLTHLAYLGADTPLRVIFMERLTGRIDQFVIGMLAGCAFVLAERNGWRPARPALWWFAGLAGMLLLSAAIISVKDVYWSGHPLLFVWHSLFSACLAPLLLSSSWNAAPARMILSNRPMRYLGDISFGVYLWHMSIVVPIVSLLPLTLGPAERFWLLLAIVLPASILIAHLSRRFVELPFLRRKPAHRRYLIESKVESSTASRAS